MSVGSTNELPDRLTADVKPNMRISVTYRSTYVYDAYPAMLPFHYEEVR